MKPAMAGFRTLQLSNLCDLPSAKAGNDSATNNAIPASIVLWLWQKKCRLQVFIALGPCRCSDGITLGQRPYREAWRFKPIDESSVVAS